MKRLLCFAVLAAILGCTATAGFSQATVVTTNEEVPLDLDVWVPCACDGAGEWIRLTGRLHELSHTTIDANGGFHVQIHSQPKDLKGEGLTSGDTYQGTGIYRWNHSGDSLPYEYTFVWNFRMIGQGPGNNLLVHESAHITINANGVVVTDFSDFRAECK